MAKSERLTDALYQERRRELERSLRAAEADNEKASLQAALGEISDGEAAQAAARVDAIKRQISQLDVARSASERQEADEAAATDKAARKQAAKTLKALDAKRAKATKAIAEIVASLGPHVQALNEVEADMLKVIRPLLASSDIGSFLSEIRDRQRERLVVEKELFAAGFGDWGLGVKFPGPMADLDILNAMKSDLVNRIVRMLDSDEDD